VNLSVMTVDSFVILRRWVWSFRDHLWFDKKLVAFYTPFSFTIWFLGQRWVRWIVNVFLSTKHLIFVFEKAFGFFIYHFCYFWL